MSMQILRPSYRLAESESIWFRTYQKHHEENLSMATTAYDTCLLTSFKDSMFGSVGLQTDGTLILGDKPFIELEKNEPNKA